MRNSITSAIVQNQIFNPNKLYDFHRYLVQKEEQLAKRERVLIEREKWFLKKLERPEENVPNLNQNLKRTLNAKNIGAGLVPRKKTERRDFKFLVVGDSKLSKNRIQEIIKSEYQKFYGSKLNKNAIHTPVLDYKRMKTFDLKKKLISDKFDFVMVGPRPHSTANKGIKESLLTIKREYNLKYRFSNDPDSPITEKLLRVHLHSFFQEKK